MNTTEESAFNVQVGGSHYKDMKFQPIEFILANGLGFCEGNAIKYICRYRFKGGIEDLKKAKHYIDLLIETEKVNATIAKEKVAIGYEHYRRFPNWDGAGGGMVPDEPRSAPTDSVYKLPPKQSSY